MTRIYAKIPTSYTFTGNARQATFGVSENAPLETHVLSYAGADAVRFKRSNVRIVRARLVPSGAAGLMPAKEKIAARLQLSFVTQGQDNGGAPFTMSFYKWGELEQQEISTGMPGSDGDVCELAINASGTEFTCDDYNVDSAFVGQSFVPILELEIECGGLTAVVTP